MAESLPISGYIDPKAFPFLIIDLHRQSATGSLKVEGGQHQKALYFKAGRILFGSSNDPRDQLGAILIESGRISEQQFEDVNKKVGPGNPLAKALSDSGIVSQRELSEAARAKVERILSDVLSYESGSFEFEDGVLPRGAVDLKLWPERLFLAAVRRVSDRGFVLRHLDGLDTVLTGAPSLPDRLPEIETELLGLAPYLDGQRTLKEAASLAGVDEFEAAKVACGLIFLGLVEKSSAVVADFSEASPFFVADEEAPELSFVPSEPMIEADEPAPTLPFETGDDVPFFASELAPGIPQVADETVLLASTPVFMAPEVTIPARALVIPRPEATVVPAPSPIASASLPPSTLKIIAPPERTRPPGKPTKDDLAALDQLLGNRPSPEGPLTPIQKAPADEWKPQFLPKTAGGAGSSLNPRLVGAAVGGLLLVAAIGGGWSYWSGRGAPAVAPDAVHASPSPVPTPVASPQETLPSVSPAGGEAAASPPPTQPSVPVTEPSTAPPTPAPSAKAPPASPSASPAHAATPAPTRPAAGGAGTGPGSRAEARSLLRQGQLVEAARGFLGSLTANKDGFSVQILVACSTSTVEKAVSNVAGDDLFILPIHYQGKACYRLAWGVYANEAEAAAAARDLPAYFRANGAHPKVVRVAETLR